MRRFMTDASLYRSSTRQCLYNGDRRSRAIFVSKSLFLSAYTLEKALGDATKQMVCERPGADDSATVARSSSPTATTDAFLLGQDSENAPSPKPAPSPEAG